MKKWFVSIISAVIILECNVSGSSAFAAEKPDISALAAVLISQDTGEIIFSVNADKKLPMASTTKIMTTLLCLESGNLDEEFVVDSDAIQVEGSSMGLVEGDIVTKYALCCGMMLPSGNDAANAAAVKLAGSIENFSDMMNRRGEEISLTRTHFETPSGLDAENHGSTAYDMAILAREALKNEIFREICSSSSKQVSFGNPPYKRWLKNSNKLLNMYEGVCGVKTGFTDEAGRCLVSACERDGKRLICVTLNDKNDWNDHIAMYDYGFAETELKEIALPESFQAAAAGDTEDENLFLMPETKTISVTAFSPDMEKFSFHTEIPPFIYAPAAYGEVLGSVRIEYDGREIENVPLYADRQILPSADEEDELNTFDKIISWFRKLF